VNQPKSPLPDTIVWAWARPTDLTFIDPARVGVASLVATVHLDDTLGIYRFKQAPRVPPGTRVLPVVRLATTRTSVNAVELGDLVALVASHASSSLGLQFEFEARASQRALYRQIVSALRDKLGPRTFFSVTALTSWCIDDPWLAGLPVDEIVPMYYRLGPDADAIARRLARAGDFPIAACRKAVGLSTDTIARPPTRAARRVYYFHPAAIDDSVLASALQGLARGRKYWW
jgi:hypothetical protein